MSTSKELKWNNQQKILDCTVGQDHGFVRDVCEKCPLQKECFDMYSFNGVSYDYETLEETIN